MLTCWDADATAKHGSQSVLLSLWEGHICKQTPQTRPAAFCSTAPVRRAQPERLQAMHCSGVKLLTQAQLTGPRQAQTTGQPGTSWGSFRSPNQKTKQKVSCQLRFSKQAKHPDTTQGCPSRSIQPARKAATLTNARVAQMQPASCKRSARKPARMLRRQCRGRSKALRRTGSARRRKPAPAQRVLGKIFRSGERTPPQSPTH